MIQTTTQIPLSIWQTFAGTSVGKAHIDANIPNQDNFFTHSTESYSIAVVCDGAGSAKHSAIGSQFFSQAIGKFLLTNADALFADSQAESLVRVHLNQIRDTLKNQIAQADALEPSELRDYHTTVTAVILSHLSQRALVIQVGDSPLIHSHFLKVNGDIDYFTDVSLLGDESKNEYVNETHFITQDNWQDFLRVAWLDTNNIDMIALMSDGCADLVIEGAKRSLTIYRPFFGNLVFNLCTVNDAAQGNQVIYDALANSATYRLTGDDKTLVVLVKNPLTYRGLEPLMQPSKNNVTPVNITTADATTNSVWHQGATVSKTVSKTADSQSGIMPAMQSYNDKNTLGKAQFSQNILPQPNSDTQTGLLPPAPISHSGKQRRNTAIMAGLATLVGAGTLFWLNQDKVMQATSADSNTVPLNASSVVQTAVALTPFNLEDPTAVALSSLQPKAFDAVIAIPTDSQNQPLLSLKTKVATLSLSAVRLDPVATVASGVSASASAIDHTSISTIHMPVSITCQPLATDRLNQLSILGVAIDKAWQYQHCKVSFTDKSFPKTTSNVHLLKGLSELIEVEKSNHGVATSASNTTNTGATNTASAVPTGDATQIQLYYLPSPLNLLNDANPASTATVSASTTHS